MGGEAFGQKGAQRALGGAVGLGDGRGIALGLDQQGRTKERANDAARQIRRGFGRGDEGRVYQGSGAGVVARLRRKAITSARCDVLLMPAKAMRVPEMARAGALMKVFSAS